MHELIKPDGTKVLVNDTSLAYALSLGWEKATEEPEVTEPEVTEPEVKPSGNSQKRSK